MQLNTCTSFLVRFNLFNGNKILKPETVVVFQDYSCLACLILSFASFLFSVLSSMNIKTSLTFFPSYVKLAFCTSGKMSK